MADNENSEVGGRVITAVTAEFMITFAAGLGEFKVSGKGAGLPAIGAFPAQRPVPRDRVLPKGGDG